MNTISPCIIYILTPEFFNRFPNARYKKRAFIPHQMYDSLSFYESRVVKHLKVVIS